MSTSPDRGPATVALRGVAAGTVATARFDVSLGAGAGVPAELLDGARAAAHASGYAAGWAQGRREAATAAAAERDRAAAARRQEVAERTAAADRGMGSIAAAAAALERRALPTMTELEQTIVRSAVVLAEALLGVSLSDPDTRGPAAIARALALAPAGRPVTVRLHPADHLAVIGDGPAEQAVDGRRITLLADPRLAPGEAVAECDATTVDARIGPALDRVRSALGLAGSDPNIGGVA
jgi:flagellar assembly protein FliH